MEPEPRPRHRLIEAVQERRDRHRTRSRAIRAVVAIAGFVVVLVGLAMIPLPGPGLLVTAAGLAILALEFAWAERLLERTVDRMTAAGDQVKKAPRWQQAVLVGVGLAVAAAMVTFVYVWDVPLLPV